MHKSKTLFFKKDFTKQNKQKLRNGSQENKSQKSRKISQNEDLLLNKNKTMVRNASNT